MLPEWIAHLTAARGFEANDLPRPDKLLLGRQLLGVDRRRCREKCNCSGGEQRLVHGNPLASGLAFKLCGSPPVDLRCSHLDHDPSTTDGWSGLGTECFEIAFRRADSP